MTRISYQPCFKSKTDWMDEAEGEGAGWDWYLSHGGPDETCMLPEGHTGDHEFTALCRNGTKPPGAVT